MKQILGNDDPQYVEKILNIIENTFSTGPLHISGIQNILLYILDVWPILLKSSQNIVDLKLFTQQKTTHIESKKFEQASLYKKIN